MSAIYEVYKGTELLATGSDKECAAALGVKPATIQFYASNAYKRRLAKRKRSDTARIAVRIDTRLCDECDAPSTHEQADIFGEIDYYCESCYQRLGEAVES